MITSRINNPYQVHSLHLEMINIDKECRPRSDSAEYDISSEAALFTRMYMKNDFYTPGTKYIGGI